MSVLSKDCNSSSIAMLHTYYIVYTQPIWKKSNEAQNVKLK